MSAPKYVRVQGTPFSPADLADLACHLEDEAGHGIDNRAAGRLLASVQHVEQLLLAMMPDQHHVALHCGCQLEIKATGIASTAKVLRADPNCAWIVARAYLVARGLLPDPLVAALQAHLAEAQENGEDL